MAKAVSEERTLICKNRRALHDYEIDDRLEAGIVLVGSEVKSCRNGSANVSDAYVQVKDGEAFLINGHIGEYTQANRFNHETRRTRKLLLHRNQIDKLFTKLVQGGQSAVPLSMYFKDGRVKLELAIGKGRKKGDRRAAVKDRESQREMQRALRSRNRR